MRKVQEAEAKEEESEAAKEAEEELERLLQKRFEKLHGNRQDWTRPFCRNPTKPQKMQATSLERRGTSAAYTKRAYID